MSPSLFSRIHGCIAGLALGDAYGIIGQLTPEANRAMWGAPPDDLMAPLPEDKTVHAGMRRAEITDDTLAMLALVRNVIANRALTLEGAAAAIVGWIEETDGFNIPWVGPSTRRAVRALLDGGDPRETGHQGTTNGSSMRVAPIGFLGAPDLTRAAELAVISAFPTHAAPVATAGAAAVACAVAAAAGGADLDGLVEAAIEGAKRGAEQGVAGTMAPSVARRIRWAVDLARSAPDEAAALRDIYDLVGTSMATHETVPAALAYVVLAEGDPFRAIRLATWGAGDCDTLGAIAGAIGGAYRGVEAIPASLRQAVDEANGLNLAQTARDYHDAVLAINPGAQSL